MNAKLQVGLQFDNTPDSVPDGPKLASVKKISFVGAGEKNRAPTDVQK
jgi:hypothetical protein